MVDPTPVRRCVCMNVSFEQLKRSGVSSLDEAMDRYRAGTKCGACRPYIEEMCESGDTAFPILQTLRYGTHK